MAKIMALPPIPGVRDLQTLMAFIMNKEEYDARLNDLVTLQAEIQEVMGKVGKAKDIDALLSSAMQKDAEAAVTLDAARSKAKAEAAAILQAASVEVQTKATEAERIYQDTVEKAASLAISQDEFDGYKAQVEADLDQRLKACEQREAESLKAKAEAEALLDAYNAKLAKLKAATEGV